MDGKEVLRLLKIIEKYYPKRFQISKSRTIIAKDEEHQKELEKIIENEIFETIRDWHKYLKDYEFDRINDALDHHITTSSFPPAISDLISIVRKKNQERAIPTVEETVLMLQFYENTDVVDKQVAQENLAKIREILGIRRG